MKHIKYIDHTADVGVIVSGTTIEEVFSAAAEGLFAIILEREHYREICETIDVRLKSASYKDLLREWLAELLYFHATRKMIFCNFKILEVSEHQLEAIAEGFQFNDTQALLATEVKSVTYHGLEFNKAEHGYTAQIIFDT